MHKEGTGVCRRPERLGRAHSTPRVAYFYKSPPNSMKNKPFVAKRIKKKADVPSRTQAAHKLQKRWVGQRVCFHPGDLQSSRGGRTPLPPALGLSLSLNSWKQGRRKPCDCRFRCANNCPGAHWCWKADLAIGHPRHHFPRR